MGIQIVDVRSYIYLRKVIFSILKWQEKKAFD